MCTLTYIPTSEQEFIFTTNRDEDPKRIALAPQTYTHGGQELIYPKDSKANGSWVISNSKDTTLCLLNGGFERHERKITYRQSRGLMLLDFFKYRDLNDFIGDYQFEGVEPFTLVIIENKTEIRLTELVWNEFELSVKEFSNSEAHIWSSTTLYTNEMKLEREEWFRDWLKEEAKKDKDSILKFHKTGGEGNLEYGLFMNRRNLVRTVSITQIIGSRQGHKMHYYNLLDKEACELI